LLVIHLHFIWSDRLFSRHIPASGAAESPIHFGMKNASQTARTVDRHPVVPACAFGVTSANEED
jgi:hypothetical protein